MVVLLEALLFSVDAGVTRASERRSIDLWRQVRKSIYLTEEKKQNKTDGEKKIDVKENERRKRGRDRVVTECTEVKLKECFQVLLVLLLNFRTYLLVVFSVARVFCCCLFWTTQKKNVEMKWDRIKE